MIKLQEYLKLKEMHQLALEVRSRAYCPYSKFEVGTCILGSDGNYYTGCNVENIVDDLCAQRGAIAKMVSNGCKQIKQVYVITELTGQLLSPPCGFCRQFIREFSKNDEKLMIHIGSIINGYQASISLATLLPFSPGPKQFPNV